MENLSNLHWALGLLALQFVFLIYCIWNINDVNKRHEGLKSELKQRLFASTEIGHIIDLKQVLGALLTYQKLKIKAGTIQIVKDKDEK